MLCAIGHYLYCKGRNTNDCLHLHLHLLYLAFFHLVVLDFFCYHLYEAMIVWRKAFSQTGSRAQDNAILFT